MTLTPSSSCYLANSFLGREARVLDIDEFAAGLLEIEIRATPPPGGWQPGHEIQFRVDHHSGRRRYAVRTVGHGQDRELMSLLVNTKPGGPGTQWIRKLRRHADITVIAGRQHPPRRRSGRCLFMGDASTLATVDAYAEFSATPIVALEVPEHAVVTLIDRWPHYHFIPETNTPGKSLMSWLDQAIGNRGLTDLGHATLLGHSESVKAQRTLLIDRLVLDRQAITTRPYWADGTTGSEGV